jgi:hypothetical protein
LGNLVTPEPNKRIIITPQKTNGYEYAFTHNQINIIRTVLYVKASSVLIEVHHAIHAAQLRLGLQPFSWHGSNHCTSFDTIEKQPVVV